MWVKVLCSQQQQCLHKSELDLQYTQGKQMAHEFTSENDFFLVRCSEHGFPGVHSALSFRDPQLNPRGCQAALLVGASVVFTQVKYFWKYILYGGGN